MKSSLTRTELLAFWYWMLMESRPSRSMSNPASRSTRALCSSRALHQMKSRTSGWSTLRMTILAARRVFPPDLIVPAEASAPRMNDTGPDASPPLKIMPSSTYQLRIDGMVSSTDRMKQADACGSGSTPTLNQTGELKAAFWLTSRWVSSDWKDSASASAAK